jgi:BirA family biotin operon repressor/biotin-[acetyl-CoA-carboxylase] ligase
MRWPAEAIWEAVYPQLPTFTVEVLPSIDSTNSELMRRARAGLGEPVLLVAESQTAGRGRMDRPWRNSIGASLMFSLGLPLAPKDWSGLSLAVGLSVAESLQPLLPMLGADQPRRLGLKWPNDLWTDGDHKLGGILVETANLPSPSTLRYVVVGVGINIQAPQIEGLSTPPAALQDLVPGLDAPGALERMAAPLVSALLAFEQHGFAPLRSRFVRRDILQGREVLLSDGTAGVTEGVGDDGALLVRTATGLQAIHSNEVSVRPTQAAPPLGG